MLTLTAAGLLAGCDDTPTGPSATGSVRAYVQDDPSSPAPARSGTSSETWRPRYSSHGANSYSGTFTAQAQVAIAAGGDVWIDLGPPRSTSVAMNATGQRADVHGEVRVPVGVYTKVRLVLSGAQARLAAGSSIGGLLLSGSVTMTVGTNGSVVIEREVPPFEVRADARTSVYWDLNSHFWVNEQNTQDEQVDEQEADAAAESWTAAEPSSGGQV